MTWTCPECGRNFRSTHQPHSCATVPLEKHFAGKPVALRAAFDKILMKVSESGPIQVNALNGAILLAGKSTFMAFKTRREYAEIEILSDKEINEFPVYKTFRVSASRVALFIRVQSPEEIDQQLIRWIMEAYEQVGR